MVGVNHSLFPFFLFDFSIQAMVQFVSSSEPDSIVSQITADSAQSPAPYDYQNEKGG